MPVATIKLPRRLPWQQAIMDRRARFVVAMCGRRAGKTTEGEVETAEALINGQRAAWFAPSYKLALEVWRDVLAMLGPLVKRSSEQERRVELHTGGVWEVWTLDGGGEPARGRSYDLVVIDEAGLVPDLLRIWDAAIRPTLADRKGRALFLGTPLGRRSGFVVLFERAQDERADDWHAVRVGTADNPYIPRSELESTRAEAERNGTVGLWEQEWLGIPADDGSNPIGLSAIKRAESDRSERPIAAVGIDLAQSVDYTAVYAVDALGRWVHVERWQAPWSVTKRRLAAWLRQHCSEDGRELSVPVCVDASGVGSPVVGDLHTMGLAVRGIVFTAAVRRKLLEQLIVDVQGGRLSLPRREDAQAGFVVSELEALGTEVLPSGAVRYAVPDGMHDDGIMAAALCCEAFKGAAVVDWPKVTTRAMQEDQSAGWKRQARERSKERADASAGRGAYLQTVRWESGPASVGDDWESVDY